MAVKTSDSVKFHGGRNRDTGSSVIVTGAGREVYNSTITSDNITTGVINLPNSPIDPTQTTFSIDGISDQFYGKDYNVVNAQLYILNSDIILALSVGDNYVIVYEVQH